MVSILFGVVTWISLEVIAPEGICPPQLAGLGAAIIGMLLGSLAPRYLRSPE